MITERRQGLIQRAEDEPSIGFDARQLCQVEFQVLGGIFRVSIRPWHAAQLAVVLEIPAMVRTLKPPLVAFLESAECRSPVRTSIVEGADHTLIVSRHDQRAQTELCRDVIVVVRDLAFMGKIDPRAAEDVLHLGIEDCGIRVQRLMHAVFLNQVVPIVHAVTEFSLHHGLTPREGRFCFFAQKKSKYSFCSQSVISSLAGSRLFAFTNSVKRSDSLRLSAR